MIDTFAGGKIPSGIPAQNAYLQSVSGITRDPSGRLVFTDSQQNVIRRINSDGTIETIAGQGIPGFGGDGGPAAKALLSGPAFPQYDASGDLYFADVQNLRIRRIDPAGSITTVAGTGIASTATVGKLGMSGPATQAQIWYITGLAIDPAGNVYFTEVDHTEIHRVTPAANIEVYADCPECDALPGMLLAADSSGNLYVSDVTQIFKITPDRVVHNFAGFGSASNNGNGGPALNAPLSNFIALASDGAGNVYTEEEQAGTIGTGPFVIRRIGTDGIINVVAGTFTNGAHADGPALQEGFTSAYGSGLTARADGTVTFAEDLRIRQLTKSTVQTMAGGAPLPAPDGTPAIDAWFVLPNAIAFDRAGDLYVAQDCIIQKIDSKGVLSTVAGTGVCSGTVAPISGPALKAELEDVNSIAVDSHGQVYFADFFGTLYSIPTDGIITKVASLGLQPLLAMNPQDQLYYLGLTNVARLLPGPPVSVSGPSYGQYFGKAISTDEVGNVYVCCDHQTGTIDEYTPDLKLVKTWPGETAGITVDGLAIDASGTIWQGGPLFGILKGDLPFGSDGVSLFKGSYGDGGPAESALILPSDMAFAPNGDLYFLDADAGRIRRIHGSPPAIAPSISAGGIVNAASLAGGAVAPGELISIFGSNFGPPGLDIASPQNNVVPDGLNNVHVLFNGTFGRITARTPNQINVFVPYGVAGGTSIQITVDVDTVTSQPVTVPIAASAFGLSTSDGSGSGQGAILNQDGSYNSASNPAARGTIVTLFGTGEGVTTPALPDGALEISTPYSAPTLPVTVKFGGETAEVPYAGAAPFLPTGVFQIDATIPMGVAPGNVPVAVSIGGSSTTRNLTVAVK